MASILMDVLKPEIDEKIHVAVDTAVSTTRRNDLFIYVQEGDMKLENAAKRAGMTTDQFQAQMDEYVKTHSTQEMQPV